MVIARLLVADASDQRWKPNFSPWSCSRLFCPERYLPAPALLYRSFDFTLLAISAYHLDRYTPQGSSFFYGHIFHLNHSFPLLWSANVIGKSGFPSGNFLPNRPQTAQKRPGKLGGNLEYGWRITLHIFHIFRIFPDFPEHFSHGIQEVSGSISLISTKLQPKGWSLLFLKLCGESVRSGHPGRGVPTVRLVGRSACGRPCAGTHEETAPKENTSLRTSAHTGVAIPEIEQNLPLVVSAKSRGLPRPCGPRNDVFFFRLLSGAVLEHRTRRNAGDGVPYANRQK